jgi:hypothetical protein
MKLGISGVGLYARGLRNWRDFERLAAQGFPLRDGGFLAPEPAAIPARERRRAPLAVKLAVEVAHQACDMAGADKGAIASVFTSTMGDTDITDYLCRALVGPAKLLSPTKFHNSVHNAPSGYWSISAGNRAPSSFAGDFHHAFPAALLEAATLCASERLPVLIAAYDIANGPPFADIRAIAEPFAAALVLEPAATAARARAVEIGCASGCAEAPAPRSATLRALAAANPSAYCLPLLEALTRDRAATLRWPLGAACHLSVSLATGSFH